MHRDNIPNYIKTAQFKDFAAVSDEIKNITLENVEAIKPYVGWKQLQQFFKSGLTRKLKAAVVMDKHRKRILLRMTVHPRGTKSISHDVIVVMNETCTDVIHGYCNCAMGYVTHNV